MMEQFDRVDEEKLRRELGMEGKHNHRLAGGPR
jgi:hypothetical protein